MMAGLCCRVRIIGSRACQLLNLTPPLALTPAFPINAVIERRIHRWVAPTLRELKKRADRMPKKEPNPRNTFLEWNHDAELYAFGKRLNEEFDPLLLKQAFTHRSYIIQEEMRQKEVGIENPELRFKDNTELIEEGDKFMSSYIRSYLEVALPKFPEPGIIAIRNYLITIKMLANVSKHLGTKDIIFSSDYPVEEITLANTFKALVAALIKSSGEEKAAHFVRDFVITNLNGIDVNELWPIEKPLEYLTELLKDSNKSLEPRLIGEIGKNSLIPCSQVGIYIDKEMFCAGFGESIPIALEMAAREGLKIFFGTTEDMAPIDFKIPGIPKQLSQQIRISAK